ncbi:response regulator [Acutalibacter caecimuris]|uniref:response regulator n=1 Tax=Acutalibacter caecimuris TaxID=3093657 RepID=UPI002AC9CEA8|nr:response regulator [Acutalibacter sp. M00118]
MINNALPRSLKISIAVIICLTIVVFSFLGWSIHKTGESTIEDVGTAYMHGMNEQVSLHFATIIELRLTMAESIAYIASGEDAAGYGSKEEIEYGAAARHFSCAALYSTDGEIEMIYGGPVTLNHPGPFLESLKNGERKAASAVDSNGEGVILFGVPCAYPMAGGNESLAIVVGLSTKYMSQVLFLDSDSSLSYSFVIRQDGSYVVGNEDSSSEGSQENYFDRLYQLFIGEDEEAAPYVAEMAAAMEAGADYSALIQSGGVRRHLYCTNLPYCDWYLVTVLPFDRLDQAISGMSSQWIALVYFTSFVVIAMLLYLFFRYFRVFRDQVAELKRMNIEMDAARKEAEQANAAKQEFLSSMSHDIRTPMNAILGMTSLAANNTHNPEQVEDYLRKISLSSKHLLGLINDVLDISKIESGKMTLNIEPISLREIMESIVNIIQPQVKAKRQHFHAAAYEILSEEVCCDSVRLNQVLINLLGNAVKFTPEGGFVQVTVYQEALPEDTSCVRTHFLVSDTGIGMSDEYQKVIFESFSREDNTRVQKTEGSGLGMAITKCIVDTMGGSISVRSQQGKGSEFHVVVDLAKGAGQPAGPRLPNWNILVVDGDERLCTNTARTLQSLGLRAGWCLSAEEAIDRLTGGSPCQLVLLGGGLPGLSALEAAQAIRRRCGETGPALLLASCDWSGVEEEARSAGVAGFVSKPLFRSSLLDALQAFAGTSTEETACAEKPADQILCGKHILLAEDNELNWEVARELLSPLEMELDWVENGQACLAKFQASPAGYYDAILMDVRMPVMDGHETTEAIRKLDRPDAGLPIIAMTADAFSEDIQKCLASGMNDHLAKPIDTQAVARKLRKYLK